MAANDELDGLLVRGEKGTAKSTAVRALRDLLPTQRAVADCPYGCHPEDPDRQCADCRARADVPTERRPVPLVTLPLGATRDRVVGTLSVDGAFEGNKSFEPGLLARANRGILYVDEVNLLEDHLVDVLLDAAAGGVNRVERDGVSVAHPSAFTLIGTMNPEEGDLRPQLRDRFALQATVAGCEDLEDRVAVIEGALGDWPAGAEATEAYAEQFRTARECLADVSLPGEMTARIAELCRDAGVDGHRGDVATARTARTLAALDGRSRVVGTDVRRAAELALPHRLESRPFEDAPDPEDVLEDHLEDDPEAAGDRDDEDGQRTEEGSDDGSGERSPDGPDDGRGDPGPEGANGDRGETKAGADDGNGGGADGGDAEAGGATPVVPGQERAGIGDAAAPDVEVGDVPRADPGAAGSRARALPDPDGEGPRVRTARAGPDDRVDAAASVRAAARRGGDGVERRDLRRSVRASDASALVLFVVDASASMRPAMRAAKGTVLELLKDAYRQRDEVGFVAVAGESADVVLPPTDSVTHAARHLKDLPTGDRTPLPDGLWTAAEVLDRADPAAGVVVLVTDGRANVADGSPTDRTREAARELADRDARVVVVDAGDGSRAGVTDIVLEATDGERVPLAALSAERVDAAAGSATEI